MEKSLISHSVLQSTQYKATFIMSNRKGHNSTSSISALEMKHNELAFGVSDSSEGEEKFITVCDKSRRTHH